MATRRTESLRSAKYAGTRRALFDAAMRLFRERGFDETSVEAIADAAGFSRATFFNHFGSKPAVLRYYGEELHRRVARLLAAARPAAAPLDRLRDALLLMARDAEASRDDLKILFAHSVHDVEYLSRPTTARSRTVRLLAALVADAQRRGHARRDVSAREQARHLLGLYDHAMLTVVFGGRALGPAIDVMWKLATGGMRA